MEVNFFTSLLLIPVLYISVHLEVVEGGIKIHELYVISCSLDDI